MRVHIDEKSDAIYIRLDDSKIMGLEEIRPGIIFDFNENNQVVGIEILKVKNRIPLSDLKQIQFEVA
jgi:uncharacterized protein YuzE